MRTLGLASVTAVLCATAGAADFDFAEVLLDTGFQVEQPILVGSLADDGARHIVLAGRDAAHKQRLAVYEVGSSTSGPSEPMLSLEPDARLIAYDVGRIGTQESLFFIEPGRILRYDIATEQLIPFVEIRTIYGQDRAGEIVPVDFLRDINQDERDDLIVRDTAGYRVRLQQPDGSLGAEVVLQESSSMTVSDGFVSFENRPLFIGDMNFDGLADLVVWRGDSLRVYPQLSDLRYQGKPKTVPLPLDLLSEAELRALQTNQGAVDQSSLTEKRIWSIDDLNNDQLPDILTEATLSEGVFDKRNEFRLHLGRQEAKEVVYHRDEDALIPSAGLQIGVVSTDIDGDGKKDLVIRKVRLSFGRVIRALLSGSVSLQLHFYKMTADDSYPEKANYVTKTNVRFSVTSGQVDIPAIQVADFDADGLQDLMMQTNRGELSFYHGNSTDKLFNKEPAEINVVLPRNGDLVATDDINGDGKSDLLIRYNVSDGVKIAETVRLLVSTT